MFRMLFGRPPEALGVNAFRNALTVEMNLACFTHDRWPRFLARLHELVHRSPNRARLMRKEGRRALPNSTTGSIAVKLMSLKLSRSHIKFAWRTTTVALGLCSIETSFPVPGSHSAYTSFFVLAHYRGASCCGPIISRPSEILVAAGKRDRVARDGSLR